FIQDQLNQILANLKSLSHSTETSLEEVYNEGCKDSLSTDSVDSASHLSN
ncbi:hypothetical protein GX50_08574, partial [[Emmonsia] crescens]